MTKIPGDRFYNLAKSVADGEIGEFLYCLQDGRFLTYENGIWKNLPEIKFLAILQEKLIRSRKVPGKNGEFIEQKGQILTAYPPSRKKQIIEQFKLLKYRELDEFNISPLINFENCMYDLENDQQIEHHHKYLSTIRVPYVYSPEVKCDLWIKSLLDIFESDQQKIEALQEFCGYCISASNEQKKALLLLGETDTGKSTIIDVVTQAIGEENVSNVPLSEISDPQKTSMLIGKLVNIDPEVNKEAVQYERQFKVITGGKDEKLLCNPKYVAPFTFRPRCKVILAANIFPRITDHSSAFYQRLLLIPCNRRFSEAEKDRDLPSKLKSELPGIFNWMLEGLRRLKERGRFREYNFLKDAVRELENINNPTNLFFEEHVIEYEESYIEKGDLYDKYAIWAKKNNIYPLSSSLFSTAVYKKYSKNTPKDTQHPMTKKRIWKNIKYIEFRNSSENQNEGWHE